MCKSRSGRLRKADFEKLTAALQQIRCDNLYNGQATAEFVSLVNTIATVCENSNYNFERKTFKHNVYKG